jgi:hypothetical protein
MSNGNLLSQDQVTKIEQYLDNADNAKRFASQGQLVYRVFREDRGGRDNVSSQVRNLQQVTTSATKLSDIEDFIKNQMGKTTGAARRWRQDHLGEELLGELQQHLRKAATELAGGNPYQEIQIRLRLARGWVRAVVSEYLFCKAQEEIQKDREKKK